MVYFTSCLRLPSPLFIRIIEAVSKNKKKSPIVIKLKGVKKRYGVGDAEHNALNGVNLTIRKGEFVAIMGPSGCGKTTLLNILGLLDHSSGGQYFFDGVEVSNLSRRVRAKIRNQKIGFIFQDYNLISRLNVIDNVGLPLLYAGKSKTYRLERSSQVLADFNLQNREYYMPWQLSGGQTQRVAIARALVSKPELILADEPTGAVDSRASHIIMEELHRINQQGNTIVMVTHNAALTAYADRIIIMSDGQIVSDVDNNSGEKKSYPVVKTVDNQFASKSYFRKKIEVRQ